MSKQNDPPDMNQLAIDDDQDENVFASPESGATTQKQTPTSTTSSARKEQQRLRAQPEAREAQLRAELERVQEVSRVIEGVTASLEKAKANMGTVQRTVESASTLLGTWTRILNQTEHNQRLILNPNWQGATQDLDDAENEDLRKQQDAERRVLEEQRRKEEAQRKAEEEERRRAVAAPTGGRGSKTRVVPAEVIRASVGRLGVGEERRAQGGVGLAGGLQVEEAEDWGERPPRTWEYEPSSKVTTTQAYETVRIARPSKRTDSY
ncbi:hypothetical protein LTR74_013468 [Friedmanniomyces endolithicus]|nr:hypothetical protein LTR74_013468 [Friedmanniomyces endolithicus]